MSLETSDYHQSNTDRRQTFMTRSIWLTLIICFAALALFGCSGFGQPVNQEAQATHPVVTGQVREGRPTPSQSMASEEPYPARDSTNRTAQPLEPDTFAYPDMLETPTPIPTPATLPTLSVGVLPPRLAPGSPVTISSIDMIDTFSGWAIGGRQNPTNHVLRTHDGGQTWVDVSPPFRTADENVPGNIGQAYFLDAKASWVVVYYRPETIPQEGFYHTAIVWRTLDGGLTWEASEPIGMYEIYYTLSPFMQFLDAQHGWILIRESGSGTSTYVVVLYTTQDGGETWDVVIEPTDNDMMSCNKTGMVFTDPQTGWVTLDQCPADATLGITHNGGRDWSNWIDLPPPDFDPRLHEQAYCVDAYSPHLFSSSSGALVVDCQLFDAPTPPPDILYRTDDNGQTWRASPYPGGELLFLTPEVGWALSRDIYRTIDGGQTWEHLQTVNWDGQFDFVTQQAGFAVARANDQLTLVRTFDSGRTWQLLEPEVAPGEFE
jgi:photosystem II stability/assembly factor-like uncharacterized protein